MLIHRRPHPEEPRAAWRLEGWERAPCLLLFLGVGLTLIFGLMRIVNFAHGALYMLGAFVGYSLGSWSGNYWLALAGAPVLVGLFGAAFEFSILRRLYRRDAHAFLMVTFGLALVVGEAVRLTWGSDALQVPAPPLLSGVIFLLDEPFPVYRLFLAATGVVVAVAIWQFLERSRLGLRSEEHTSELQSRLHLVCRLLLEKKKNTHTELHLSKKTNNNTQPQIK